MYGPDLSGIVRSIGIILIVLIAWGGYSGYKMIMNRGKIESKTRIQPDYRLEANGKKVDTIFIYKSK